MTRSAAKARELERFAGRLPRGSPLVLASAAAATRRLADELEHEAVAEARAEGATWQEVADALGVARQNAWRRYGGG